MSSQISSRDWEAVSAYLDGQLPSQECQQLEARLQKDQALRQVLEEARWTRALLRDQPRLRPRRNFTLSVQMVPQRRPWHWFPVFRMAFALASLLLIFALIGDVWLSPQAGQHSQAVAVVMTPVPALKQVGAAVEAQRMPETSVTEPARPNLLPAPTQPAGVAKAFVVENPASPPLNAPGQAAGQPPETSLPPSETAILPTENPVWAAEQPPETPEAASVEKPPTQAPPVALSTLPPQPARLPDPYPPPAAALEIPQPPPLATSAASEGGDRMYREPAAPGGVEALAATAVMTQPVSQTLSATIPLSATVLRQLEAPTDTLVIVPEPTQWPYPAPMNGPAAPSVVTPYLLPAQSTLLETPEVPQAEPQTPPAAQPEEEMPPAQGMPVEATVPPAAAPSVMGRPAPVFDLPLSTPTSWTPPLAVLEATATVPATALAFVPDQALPTVAPAPSGMAEPLPSDQQAPAGTSENARWISLVRSGLRISEIFLVLLAISSGVALIYLRWAKLP